MAISEADRARIRAVKARVEDALLALPGVTGVDIDEKRTAGAATGVAALVVFVSHKVPSNRLPAASRIPDHIDGVPTDVRELNILPQGGAS